MKATLDHIGIAVSDLEAALAFLSRRARSRDRSAPRTSPSQHVRAHFIALGPGRAERRWSCSKAPATSRRSRRYLAKRGPGLHHITLRVDDIRAALAQLKARGVRLIDEEPRPGAHGTLVAFIHPSSAHGVLVELKQQRRRR